MNGSAPPGKSPDYWVATVDLDRGAIDAMDQRRRAALINSLSGFKSANLVGTVDTERRSNLAIVSSLVHIGSHPPLLALVFRPDSVERHTLDNIRSTGVYTINHVSHAMIDAAHQTAARYPRGESEFAATGLSECWEQGWPAPFVGESRVRMALRLIDEQELAVNGTHLVIGEVQHLHLPEDALTEDGALDPAAAGTVALAGLDSYYDATLLQRMAYAKPDLPPRRR